MAYTKGMIADLMERFGDRGFTWKDAGIHFATLNAAVKRGYLKKIGSEYFVERRGAIFSRIEAMADGKDFFVLTNDGEDKMLCSMKGLDIFDCYEQTFTLSDRCSYRDVGTKENILLNQ